MGLVRSAAVTQRMCVTTVTKMRDERQPVEEQDEEKNEDRKGEKVKMMGKEATSIYL